MYTLMWVPPAFLFLLSLGGFLFNLRGFVLELRYTLFPARRLFWCGLFLALMIAGFAGMVWVIDLIMYRNANPAPVDVESPWSLLTRSEFC